MAAIALEAPQKTELLLGNEAIARGALEAGVRVAASYPGTPSTEILEALAKVAKERGLYVEWSVNEKVAAEVAAAASYAGLRALTALKHEGLNVALDFLSHLNTSGVQGGMVVVVCDDPEGWSSPSENDSRALIRWLNVPLLEPATAQEAKEMTSWAFALSERLGTFCSLRSCTRVSHATGCVVLGELPEVTRRPHFDTSRSFVPTPIVTKHGELLKKLEQAREAFEEAPFNTYEGPKHPELLIFASGSGRLYATEAIGCLGLQERVGLLHLGTTWPLPTQLLQTHLAGAERVLVVEEVDPFLETNLKVAAADLGWFREGRAILGKGSGHLPAKGELTPDVVIGALAQLLGLSYLPRDPDYDSRARQLVGKLLASREVVWCPGCPHRASFWAMKNALRRDRRDGFVTGDIGCYGLDRRGAGGYQITKMATSMGSGAGVASGLGKLGQFGFDQPVVSVCGDSTFFHAAIPALINARYNRSNMTMVILDNSATAMTGFQPHPGVGRNAMDEETPPVAIEAICRALDIPVEVLDPFDLKAVTAKMLEAMRKPGTTKVIILRNPCVLILPRDRQLPYRMWVDPERCRRCAGYCVRFFKCPGLRWDRASSKAQIDEALCVGCGVCTDICPSSAIMREPTDA